jgi:hypothetical protein
MSSTKKGGVPPKIGGSVTGILIVVRQNRIVADHERAKKREGKAGRPLLFD